MEKQSKGTFTLWILILVLMAFIGLAVYAFTTLDFEQFKKTGSFKACTEYTSESCPEGCSVCPPCETCSSLVCQAEEDCSYDYGDLDGSDGGSDTDCGIENCHGLDIQCGRNPAQVCTEIYEIGDKCRQYVECGVVDGQCQQVENEDFTSCKTCVEKCIAENGLDGEGLWECEGECE